MPQITPELAQQLLSFGPLGLVALIMWTSSRRVPAPDERPIDRIMAKLAEIERELRDVKERLIRAETRLEDRK